MMNASKQTKSAHPLFPTEQAFLWLPGFAGNERPYCSYNEYRDHPGGFDKRRFDFLPPCEHNGAPFITPFPVSPETHISWHTNVTPPYPYHPVPILRTLSPDELEELGRQVTSLAEPENSDVNDPQAVLRNQYKTLVLVALAKMGLLWADKRDRTANAKSA